jgi:hypothetical protein
MDTTVICSVSTKSSYYFLSSRTSGVNEALSVEYSEEIQEGRIQLQGKEAFNFNSIKYRV